MRRIWVGVLLASLPFSLLAQNVIQPRPNDGWFNPPIPRQSNDGYFNPTPAPREPVTSRPLPPDDANQSAPFPSGPFPSGTNQSAPTQTPPTQDPVVATPEPSDAPPADAPRDDSVTATPLPAPSVDDTTDSSRELVPNPLDNPDAVPAAPGGGKQTQSEGQAVHGGWVQMGTATLQALDKVNAIDRTLVVKVGDTAAFGSLDIGVRGCFVRPSDKPADATAFLVIRDRHPDAPSFTGWMVRSAPYISMMAHPIYDVHVTGCTP